MATTELDLGRYKLGWSDVEDYYVYKPKKGLSEEIIREMSWMKGEPDWMTNRRLKALRHFQRRPMPTWGGDMSGHRLRRHLLLHQAHRQAGQRLGPAARVGEGHLRQARASPRPSASTWPASPPSTRARSSTTRTGRTSKPRASCSATWTPPCGSTPSWSSSTSARSSRPTTTSSRPSTPPPGPAGSFIYVPPGVKVDMPLQAYFRINAENMGQFERTLIIADEGAQVHYIEGCSAPVYTTDSLHSAVVEIVCKPSQPGDLHDHPELVQQRLQPGHQAGPLRRPRPTWSGSTATSAAA